VNTTHFQEDFAHLGGEHGETKLGGFAVLVVVGAPSDSASNSDQSPNAASAFPLEYGGDKAWSRNTGTSCTRTAFPQDSQRLFMVFRHLKIGAPLG